MAQAETVGTLEIRENPRSWADLPNELLCEIYSRIFAGDRAVFCAVCKPWNSACSLITATQRLNSNSDCFSPLLMYSKTKVVHPIRGGLYDIDFPCIPANSVKATRDDWLLMLDYNALFFFNPFTSEQVSLPHDERVLSYFSLYFSSAPTLADCLVVAVVTLKIGGDEFCGICHRNVGDLGGWTTREIVLGRNCCFGFSFCNPVVCNGLYYFLGFNGSLLIYNPKTDKIHFGEAPKYISELVAPSGNKYMWEMASSGNKYLLESDGKILAVFVSDDGRSLYVLQWNVSKKTWEQVSSLGNRMLFLSHPLSFSEESTVRGTGNKIYFPRSIDDHILFYSLSTKRYHTFVLGTTYRDFYGSKGLPKSASWIMNQSSIILSLTYEGDGNAYATTELLKIRDLQSEQFLSENMGKRIEESKFKDQQEHIISRPPLLRQPYTWLMMLDDNGKRQAFYSITEDHYYIRHVSELENKYVSCCDSGWLVLKDKCTHELSMLNILTMKKLQLPSLKIRYHHCCVLSSPQKNRSCRIVFFDFSSQITLSCYLGENKFVERDTRCEDHIQAVINFEGKLFALVCGFWDLLTADFSDPDLNFTKVVTGDPVALSYFPNRGGGLAYLVGACGYILLISLLTEDGEISDVTIYRADISNGEWVIMENLGDISIFLDLCNVDSYTAYSSPASACGLKGNAVYWEKRRNLYMYDLEDGCISMHSACPILKTNSTSCWLSLPYNQG